MADASAYLFFYFVLPVQSSFNCIEKLVLVDETVGAFLLMGVKGRVVNKLLQSVRS